MFFLLLILVFISGAAGLIYEVLWLKQLGYLFGNSARASAVTLGVFFLGLSIGSWWWGRRAHKSDNNLMTYALLELGIFVSALFYFVVLKIFHTVYPLITGGTGSGFLQLPVNLILAFLLIGPASIFMGGTIPVLGSYIIRHLGELGKKASLLYGINTLGAATGAFMAGFYLPAKFGIITSYKVALGISLFTGVTAFVLAKIPALSPGKKSGNKSSGPGPVSSEIKSFPLVISLCIFSGFGTLCLEVLWTQMLTHVLQNTVYSFAAMVVTTLVCLGLGAGLANGLIRMHWNPLTVILSIMFLSGITICISPFLYVELTSGLKIIFTKVDWNDYIYQVFTLCFTVMGPPLLLMGALFPFLLKASEPFVKQVGKTLGFLSALNTLGAIAGALAGGFVLLGTLGLWRSIQVMGILYLVIFVVLAYHIINIRQLKSKALLTGLKIIIVVIFGAQIYPFNAGSLPAMKVEKHETIVESWNSSNGTVAVVQAKNNTLIKVNGHYSLGALLSAAAEKSQTSVPLLLHPFAKSIYYLGLGTGITASEGLSSKYNIKKSVATELIPDVIKASRKYFKEYTAPLFVDSRSKIIHADGRHYLAATREKFDVINADLFVIYRKNVGSLFTLEHFQNARDHLNPGGIFVQWIPLYQLTQPEFYIIANTMTRVFSQVTMWRGHFNPFVDAVALVGQLDNSPLLTRNFVMPDSSRRADIAARLTREKPVPDDENILLFYCGNLTGVTHLFEDSPVNTDDLPHIEYLTPKSSSMQAADKAIWFAGPHFITFLTAMLRATPPERDPALGNVSRREIYRAKAGFNLARTYLFYDAFQKNISGQKEAWLGAAQKAQENFRLHWME